MGVPLPLQSLSFVFPSWSDDRHSFWNSRHRWGQVQGQVQEQAQGQVQEQAQGQAPQHIPEMGSPSIDMSSLL